MPGTEEIEAFLKANAEHFTVIGRAEDVWDVLVPSYWKETIAVSLALSDRGIRADAFFMRAPEENAELAYKLLLQRHERAHVWKFSANEAGDVSLVAELPRDAIGDDELDRLFGTLITLVDETYVPYMKIAFATSLEEQVRDGGPGLDQPPPWARGWEKRT